MAIEVKIPTILRTYTGGAKTVEAKGDTLSALIDDLDANNPGLKGRLITDDGGLHRFVNVYVNDEDVRFTGSLDTALKDGDAVTILPAVAGGWRKGRWPVGRPRRRRRLAADRRADPPCRGPGSCCGRPSTWRLAPKGVDLAAVRAHILDVNMSYPACAACAALMVRPMCSGSRNSTGGTVPAVRLTNESMASWLLCTRNPG